MRLLPPTVGPIRRPARWLRLNSFLGRNPAGDTHCWRADWFVRIQVLSGRKEAAGGTRQDRTMHCPGIKCYIMTNLPTLQSVTSGLTLSQNWGTAINYYCRKQNPFPSWVPHCAVKDIMSAVELCFKVHARIGLLRLFYNDFSCWAEERVSWQIVAVQSGGCRYYAIKNNYPNYVLGLYIFVLIPVYNWWITSCFMFLTFSL